MEFKKISFEEYKDIRKLLLVSNEAITKEVYKDTKGIATIGIGINIESNDRLWHYLVLYCIFDLIKDTKDIIFQRNDNKQAIEKYIIYQFQDKKAYKNDAYRNLIHDIVKRYGKEYYLERSIIKEEVIDTQTLTAKQLGIHLSNNIKDTLQIYLKETKDLQFFNSKKSLEELQRLNEEDLKIDKSNLANPKYLEFKLNEQQIKKLFDIMIINYEITALDLLENKNITLFSKLKDKEEKEYYKEFIPFISSVYQSANYIKENALLEKAFNVYQSRFFIWAIIRYDFILENDRKDNKWTKYAIRMLKQSCIFGFNGKVDNEKESDEEKFNTCIDIFKVLNLTHPTKKQTYFSYFKEQDKAIRIIANSENNACKNSTNNTNCNFYHSNHINSLELQALINILNPYAKFLDTLIPNAKFENEAGFTKYNLPYFNNNLQKETSKEEYRFKLENIYIMDKSNYNEVLKAISKYTNTNITKENILVIIIDKIDTEIKINKPSNTYLYLISIGGNYLDCSLINNPLSENARKNDKAELFLYKKQENTLPQIISLSTQEIAMDEDCNKNLSANYDNITYSFDILNHLNIQKDGKRILTLTNYRFDFTYED